MTTRDKGWARCLHVVHEQGMVCPGRDNPDFDPMLQVPVKELIIHKHLRAGRADQESAAKKDQGEADTDAAGALSAEKQI